MIKIRLSDTAMVRFSMSCFFIHEIPNTSVNISVIFFGRITTLVLFGSHLFFATYETDFVSVYITA